MASPTRPTVAHRVVRAYRTTLGDRRSSRLPWNNEIHVRSLRNFGAGPKLIARTGKPPTSLALSPDATVVASADSTEEIRFWSAASNSSDSIAGREAPAAVVGLNYSDSGKSLVAVSFARGYPMYSVFDLTGPENLVPTLLAKGDTNSGGGTALDPTGQWLATSHGTEVAFWPLAGPWGRVFELNHPAQIVDFVGDGSRVLTLNLDNSVLDRPLQGGTVRQVRPATRTRRPLFYMSRDPAGRRVALSGAGGQIEIVDLATGSAQSMPGVPSATLLGKPAFSEDGRLLAVGVRGGPSGHVSAPPVESRDRRDDDLRSVRGERRAGPGHRLGSIRRKRSDLCFGRRQGHCRGRSQNRRKPADLKRLWRPRSLPRRTIRICHGRMSWGDKVAATCRSHGSRSTAARRLT